MCYRTTTTPGEAREFLWYLQESLPFFKPLYGPLALFDPDLFLKGIHGQPNDRDREFALSGLLQLLSRGCRRSVPSELLLGTLLGNLFFFCKRFFLTPSVCMVRCGVWRMNSGIPFSSRSLLAPGRHGPAARRACAYRRAAP